MCVCVFLFCGEYGCICMITICMNAHQRVITDYQCECGHMIDHYWLYGPSVWLSSVWTHISVWLLTVWPCVAISVYVWQSEYVLEYVLHTKLFFSLSSFLLLKLFLLYFSSAQINVIWCLRFCLLFYNWKYSEPFRKMVAGISFFMVSSSYLKYKLMRHVTFNPLLFWIAPGVISCIFIWNKKKNQCGTYLEVPWIFSRHFSLYNFFIFLSIINSGWWIVKPKVSSFQRHQNCVCSTLKSGTVTILS